MLNFHDIGFREHAVFVGHFHIDLTVELRVHLLITLGLGYERRSQRERRGKNGKSFIELLHDGLSKLNGRATSLVDSVRPVSLAMRGQHFHALPANWSRSSLPSYKPFVLFG